jgi:hypothetical protein
MLVLLTFKTPSIEGNCSGNGKLWIYFWPPWN